MHLKHPNFSTTFLYCSLFSPTLTMEVLSAPNRPSDAITTQRRGRPPKADAKTIAERAKAYRERLRKDGLKEIKCYLSAEHLAYLKVLCDIHGGTIADSVALALTAVMRGELPQQIPVAASSHGTSLILLP